MSHVPFPEISSGWERSTWCGESSWTSVAGEVRAIVSEERARLIYLGALDGSLNLLNAPSPLRAPTADDPTPNFGGHRFWLGPQHRWVWPPPAEWEHLAAESAATEGHVLALRHARVDAGYPAIRRDYSWEGNRLRCSVSWQDDGRGYFGLHVVAVDAPAVIPVRLESRPAAPFGVVAARMVDPEPPLQLPHPALLTDNGRTVVRSGLRRAKLGFVPQTLTADRQGGWTLSVHPGPCSQANGETPDHGYLSQVWVGEAGIDLAELEQLTPHLHGDASGRCSSTIFIEAAPPAR